MGVDCIKNSSHVDTTSFALKTNLANLKTEVDKLDIDNLVPDPIDLCKLSDVVKNDFVKKDVYDKLVAKVNNINTSGFVLKTEYDTDKSKLDKIKYLMLVVLLKKQIMILKLQKLKINLIIVIMINLLLLQNLIL